MRTLPLLVVATVLLACRGEISTVEPAQLSAPPSRPELLELLREDLASQPHPADGGGRAWLESQEPEPIRAGERGRWSLVYEAGPLGIDDGGMLLLQVSPFWGWSTPQVVDPSAIGYTTVTTEAEGVDLVASALDQQLLGISISGRRLEAGETIRLVYGAGEAGAFADRFAERETRFWISVDGDGDGRRKLVAESPAIDVLAGPPARLVAHLPSTAEPGTPILLRLAVLDRFGNAGVDFTGPVALASSLPLEALGDSLVFEAEDHGLKKVEIIAPQEGVLRIAASTADGLATESNPTAISANSPRLLWADLHGHSHFSDGTGTPEDYFAYARDVAGLDVVALTDHDHWGLEPLSQRPEMWQEIRRQVDLFHRPHQFVTVLGYEWTSWIWGHRHVLYFSNEGEILSSVDPDYETPQQLWAALRGTRALTFAHHSAGGPIATNWTLAPDAEIEPVTEVVSVHGSSEAPDSPAAIYSPVASNFVRDVLDRGYRLGLIGSGDSHDGHPGLAHLASPSGGMAAILSSELTREGVREALRAKRVYATNGPRIILRVALDGKRMGSTVPSGEIHTLRGLVVGTAPLERVDLIRRGGQITSLAAGGRSFFSFDQEIRDTDAGDYLYLRAIQEDGGAAWSSPFFFDARKEP